MRVELVELLRTRDICHPSRFILLESKNKSDIRIEVTGYPWWLNNPNPDLDRKISFYFEGISDGLLTSDVFQADYFEEDLKSFDVRPLSEHEWAKGVNCDVYCNSPLSNSLEIYASVHDFLLSAECPYAPERYLNMGNSGSISEFATIASSNSFLLCHGPEAVCHVVSRVLEICGAKFNVLMGKDMSNNLICVELLGSHLICRSAYAVFED